MQIDFSNDNFLLFSLFNLGFFTGFLHCAGMCAPFVLTQTSNILKEIPIKNYNNFQKLKAISLLPYHFGRITTYTFIGFFCAFFGKNLRNLIDFNYFSAVFLFLASLIFIFAFFNFKINFRFSPKFNFSFFKEILGNLFKNPRNFKGYFLGILLGFIPCSLLYSAFLICINFQNPFLAIFGMILFGIGTIPSLFLVSSSSLLFFKFEKKYFQKFAKFILLLNGIILFFMALMQII